MMIHKIYLNEYVYIEFMEKGDTLRLTEKYDYLKDVIVVFNENDEIIFKFLSKEFARFNKETGEVTYLTPITTTELRSVLKNKDINSLENVGDRFTFQNNKPAISSSIRTDLHTHFMELLSGEEYLSILLKYLDELNAASDYNILANPENYIYLTSGEILDDKNLFDRLASQLSLSERKQSTFKDLSAALKKRNILMDFAAKDLVKREGGDSTNSNDVAEAKGIIYVDYLVKALNILKEKGIKYVELSYSNQATIRRIARLLEEKDIKVEGIDFEFLLSANRRAGSPSFNSSIKDLEKLLNSGLVKGFDLMGEEIAFTKNDIDNIKDDASFVSRINKLLPILNQHSDSVLRLHAGENMDSKVNPFISMLVIDRIAVQRKLVLPPPQIRIGHGVYFDQSDLYAELLQKYNVIVELNASSNYALSNVQELVQIPYEWYKRRGIPCVLGTDGGGMYYTDSIQEEAIASTFGGKDVVEHIIKTEDEVLKGR